jgi:hypothetical protein
MNNYFEMNYLVDPDFIKNNATYHDLKLKVIDTVSILPTKSPIRAGLKYVYLIPSTKIRHKCGYRNIRCEYSHLISSLEVEIGGVKIAEVKNYDGVFFPELRKILAISDPDIIPLIGVGNFMPYLTCDCKIIIVFHEQVNLENITTILISYEEIEIIDDVLLLAQYEDQTHFRNDYWRLNKKIIPIIEYMVDYLVSEDYEFDRTRPDATKYQCKMRLSRGKYTSHHKEYLLVYTPGCIPTTYNIR